MIKNTIKNHFNIIFIVVVYKNTTDIIGFLESLKNLQNCTFKVIIVNSFYNLYTEKKFKQISKTNKCDFMTVDNMGYGEGNNKGINYAKLKYKFDYLIVSNPDIQLIEFDYHNLFKFTSCVIAPQIITSKNKNQNPYYLFKLDLLEFIYYISFKYRIRLLRLLPILIHKLFRLVVNFFYSKSMRIYAAHGSFVIYHCNVLKLNDIKYNKKMFLFAEENYISELLRFNSISSYYTKSIKVKHHENGSVGYLENKIFDISRLSFIVYYNTIKAFKKTFKISKRD
jgi:hypothetical protein